MTIAFIYQGFWFFKGFFVVVLWFFLIGKQYRSAPSKEKKLRRKKEKISNKLYLSK